MWKEMLLELQSSGIWEGKYQYGHALYCNYIWIIVKSS